MSDIINATQPLDTDLAGDGAARIRETRAGVNAVNSKFDAHYKIGKIEIYDDYYAPSVDWPFFCLSKNDEILTKTNWPDDGSGNGLVTHLRGKKIKYMPGTTSEKSAFDVTGWAISSNVATLTFANSTAELKILAALVEDQLVQGSYTDWRTITLPVAIGSITAGTYAITAIDAVARTVSFAFTASNGSGSVTATAEFFPHRLSTAADSGGTQARHFKVQGRGFFTVNDSDGEFIGSLRRRFRMQGHAHYMENFSAGSNYGLSPNAASAGSGYMANAIKANVITTGTDGTPLTGNKTHGPGFGVVAYIYGKTYSA